MTPDIISALVNLGSAGAVIIVVMLFQKSNKERDAEWRSFFTAINEGNKADITDMRQVAERITKSLDNLCMQYLNHDTQAKEIRQIIQDMRAELARLVAAK